MKSFKEYISEALNQIMAYSRDRYNNVGNVELIPGLINPSREQLVGYLKRVPQARFILHKDKLHVFDANDALHDDVLRAEHSDQKENKKNYSSRVREMYNTKKSLLGSFHGHHDDNFSVGLSYVPIDPFEDGKENSEWMQDLLKSHPRTKDLISSETTIAPWDM
jgi:hypothetical protein